MFGFSFPKLAVLIAILVAVWYGFKTLGRRRELTNQLGGDLRKQNRKQWPEQLFLVASIGLIVVAMVWGVYNLAAEFISWWY